MSPETIQYPPAWRNLRVALAHDWLTGMRGGEKCLELLAQGFPGAPLYCLVHKRGAVSKIIEQRQVHVSALRHIPHIERYYRYFLPLFPWAIQTMGRPDAELLISTSHCAAKSLPLEKETRHLCYCFTPMRYAWTFHEEYFGSPFKRALLAPPLAALRAWDKSTSRRVDRFVAISQHVRKRIEQFYGRDADVVYPPADTEFYSPDAAIAREDFDLIVSALVPYKKIDVAVRAYNASRRRLVVVGTGTEADRLKKIAGPTVDIAGWQPNEKIRELYRRCRLLIFPGEEDFGIVPVEAMACGTPVVALRRGGVTETVVEGETGVFFDAQDERSLNNAVEIATRHAWDPARIHARAAVFSRQAFVDQLAASIVRCMNG